MSPTATVLAAVVYVFVGRLLVGWRGGLRDPAFALLNIGAVYLFFFWRRDPRFELLFNLLFGAYLVMVIVQYVALRYWSRRAGWWPWAAFMLPILSLVVVRYAPVAEIAGLLSHRAHEVLQRHPEFTLGWVFVGVSYLAFRTSFLALEVRNGVVPRPTLSQYLGFAFFAPTMSVGPINAYSQHRRAFAEVSSPRPPIGRCLLRILIGAVKYRFIGPVLNQLTYSGLLLDGHPHRPVDLIVSGVAYYLFLYCNFSGFCDVAIGGAGLMGISVAENFANPFGARNVKDFWNRWHITLSRYMRDVVFSPLSKQLVRTFGPRRSDEAVAATIFVVFLLVGVWHGVGWHYAAFGVLHGAAVAGNHYYTLALKKRLGKEGFAAYNRSRWVQASAVAATFLFVTASLFLFANDWSAMKQIVTMLQS